MRQAMAQMAMNLDFRGTLQVDAPGRVDKVGIDNEDNYPPAMVECVRGNAAAWQFEPELRDGVAVPFHARMQLRLVGRQQGEDD